MAGGTERTQAVSRVTREMEGLATKKSEQEAEPTTVEAAGATAAAEMVDAKAAVMVAAAAVAD